MALYFLLLDAVRFQEQIRPPLADAWKQRSFSPSRPLCQDLLPAAEAFRDRYCLGPQELLLTAVLRGLPFDRNLWRGLVGEVLWFAAESIPEIATDPETLTGLLAPGWRENEAARREQWTPIEQVHRGSRDLVFGGRCYRPEAVGYNNRGDVVRLAEYLGALDWSRWRAAELAGLTGLSDPAEAAVELAFAQDCVAALHRMYREAVEKGQVIVCEDL
jgi:hypothetical protein